MQEIDLSGIKIVTFCNVEKNKMRNTRLHDKQYNQNLFRSAISGKVTEKKIVSSFRSTVYQSRLHFWLYCLLNIKLFNLIIDLFQAKPFR